MPSCLILRLFFFFFKQKTAYEMRISGWSSDVCSSDLDGQALRALWPVLLFRPDLRRLRSDEPDRALGGGPLAYHCPGDLDRWRTVPALPRLQGRKRPAAAHGARDRHYPGARTVGQRGKAPHPERLPPPFRRRNDGPNL